MNKKITRIQLKRMIMATQPLITNEIVDNYTDSELKEWAELLQYDTTF